MFGSPVKNTLLSLALCLVPVSLSLAQVTDGIRVFELTYFVQFDPVTAFDLVQRTPGFNPQEQSGGRGLDGVRSNVLINGKRPPPKGQSIRAQLSNLPYTSVTNIELINSGATLDIDMQGYNQVVNVLLEEEDTDYYELSTGHTRTGDGDVRQHNERETELDLTGNLSLGRHEFRLRGGLQDDTRRTPSDFVEIDPANPEQRIFLQNQRDQQEYYLQLSTIFNYQNDSSLSVNAHLSDWERGSAPVSATGVNAGVQQVSESSLNDRDFQEVSAEYRRPLSDRNDLMFAVVDSRNIQGFESTFADDDDLLSSIRNRESGETAARLRLTRNHSDSLTLRAIASSAFNYFQGNLRLFENGQLQMLDGSDSRVEEDRHSLTVEADWSWKDNWILQGSLSGGRYAIDAKGVSSNEEAEVKGRVSVAHQFRDRTTITWESRYDIGQLSLNQFLASSNLSSEILQAGAVRLDSERNWDHSLSYDQRFGDRGVLDFNLGHYSRENPIRVVALSDSLTVAQNTNVEKVTSFKANLAYPFERFGMEDLVLNAGFTIRDSETKDPVTGESREVSWAQPWEWNLGLRKNPGEGKWSWDIDLWNSINNKDYGVFDTSLQEESFRWSTSIQYEFFQGLRLSAWAESPQNERYLAQYFPSVRRPGLEPSYTSVTEDLSDSIAGVSLQWRLDEFLEITATINPRPRFRTRELLQEYGAMQGTFLAREVAESPRAELRIRIYNR